VEDDMKKDISLAALTLAVLTLAPVVFAQSSHKQNPMQPGTALVAWTQDQKSEPMPSQTTTAPQEKPNTQTPSSPAGQADDAHKQPAAQAFTGTIMKSGDNYVLKTADNMTYQLDDQARAKQFEGKQVQVTGSLDSGSGTIKVQDIKAAS
jgi:Protein of unknown function (DUF5818)